MAIQDGAPSEAIRKLLTKSWNQPLYSDVVVRFGGRTIHCHKFVLCQASEYFLKLCGPGSHFAGDDPEALEALLRHVYGADATATTKQPWRHLLDLWIIADKYLIPSIGLLPSMQFEDTLKTVTHPPEMVEILRALDNELAHDPRAIATRRALHESKRAELIKCAEYRTYLEENLELLWQDFDHAINTAESRGKSLALAYRFRESLNPMTLYVCEAHAKALEEDSPDLRPVVERTDPCALRNSCYDYSGSSIKKKTMHYYTAK